MALEARSTFFYSKEEMSVIDAATSYLLALAAGYILWWKLYRRFMAAAMSFVQEMGHYRRRDLSYQLSALYKPARDQLNSYG